MSTYWLLTTSNPIIIKKTTSNPNIFTLDLKKISNVSDPSACQSSGSVAELKDQQRDLVAAW